VASTLLCNIVEKNIVFSERLSIYVVRQNKSGDLKDSSPCLDCYHKMLQYGVKYIIYSNDDGSITKTRLSEFKPKVISIGRQFIDGGYIPVHRDKIELNLRSYGLIEDDNSSVCSDNSDTTSKTTKSSTSSNSNNSGKTKKSKIYASYKTYNKLNCIEKDNKKC